MSTEEKSRATTFAILSSSLLHTGLVVAVLSMQIQIPRADVIEVHIQDASLAQASAVVPVETSIATTLPAKAAAPMSSLPVQQNFADTAVAVASPEPAESEVSSEASEFAEADDSEALAQQAQEAALEADAFLDESDVIAEKAKAEELGRAQSAAKMAALRQAQSKAEFERAQEARKKSQEEAAQSASLTAAAEQKQKAFEQAKQIHAAEVRYQAARAAAARAASEAAAADQAAEEAARAAAAAQLAEENQSGAISTAQASAVRPLEDLKQMPGNEKPQYDPDDRLSGRHGVVVVYAFITSGGQPADFKLIQSSGHKSLDLKTLKAIQSWKFYPGQEGWVEIPFQWDLKGEPKAIGGTLRKVSQK